MLTAGAGLALANAMHAPAFSLVALVASAALAVSSADARLPACALALLLAGWWWGSLRLDAFEKSVLAPEIGRSASVTAVVTGPVRSSTFALKLPAEVRRFDEHSLRVPICEGFSFGQVPEALAAFGDHKQGKLSVV